jgi:RNA polymerase sigma-70 factor (ECF subfamily)
MKKYSIEHLLETYGKKVYNLAYRVTGNKQDAEDVTQDTFLQVYTSLDSFRGESKIYTWIYRIAINNSIKVKRKLNKEYIDSLDQKIELFKDDIPDEVKRWESDPEKRYLYNELLREIRCECYYFMTFRLTEEQRIAYILRVVLAFSLEDISAILQVEKNVIKARLQRAKANLCSHFSGRCQWFADESGCSCESRIGFALAYMPDLMKRLRNYPYDRNYEKIVRSSINRIRDIDEIYESFPLESYQTKALEHYIKGT